MLDRGGKHYAPRLAVAIYAWHKGFNLGEVLPKQGVAQQLADIAQTLRRQLAQPGNELSDNMLTAAAAVATPGRRVKGGVISPQSVGEENS